MERIRVGLWPRTSWQRSIKYVTHRLRRLRSTPHAIALGAAFGVFISFTPFLGFHLIIAGLLSWFSRASIVASALGTFAGNPLTYPFIWVGAYELGTWVLGEVSRFESIDLWAQALIPPITLEVSLDRAWSLLLPMTIGGTALGVVAATLIYFPLRRLVEVYQRRRAMQRLQDRDEAFQAGE